MSQSHGPELILHNLFHPQGRFGRQLPEGCSPSRYRQWMMRLAGGEEDLAVDLQEILEPWGWRLLFHLTRTGISFRILEKEAFDLRTGTWNHRSRSRGIAGIYDPERRQILVADVYWSARVVHHELAHALDPMISHRDSTFSSGLWHGFASTRKGFLSDYAASHPEEYFAVCLENYLNGNGDWLERNESGLHAFLTALFDLSSM